MHQSENDDYIAIHSGVRVRKNHTSRRDAFESIDVPPVARVKGRDVIWSENFEQKKTTPEEMSHKTNFEGAIALLKFHPGFEPNILDFLAENRSMRGIIIEGTGLGHVSDLVVSKISRLVKRGIFVGMTSQCIWGRVEY